MSEIISEEPGPNERDIAATEAWMIQQKLEAFTAGIKCASLAMESVLRRKVAVGILTEETAKKIFMDIGNELTNAFTPDEAQDDPQWTQS